MKKQKPAKRGKIITQNIDKVVNLFFCSILISTVSPRAPLVEFSARATVKLAAFPKIAGSFSTGSRNEIFD